MTFGFNMVCACARQSLLLVAGLQWRTSAKEFVSLRTVCIRTATDYHFVHIITLIYGSRRAEAPTSRKYG